MIGIYKINNILNNKNYIGQSVNIYKRWREHKRELNNNTHINDHLQNAWNKYGENAFVFEIVCLCDESSLDYLEKHYIEEYDSINNGYNLDDGGNCNKHHCEETKIKIGNANRGMIIGEEGRKRMSESAKKKFENGYKVWNKGIKTNVHHDKQFKKGHISWNKGMKGKYHLKNVRKGFISPKRKKVNQYNLNWDFIKTYESLTEAKKITGVSHITCCCSGKRETAGGYKWKFAD